MSDTILIKTDGSDVTLVSNLDADEVIDLLYLLLARLAVDMAEYEDEQTIH